MLKLKAGITRVYAGLFYIYEASSSTERLRSLIVLCSAVLEKMIHQYCALTCLVIYLLWYCAILILAFVLSSSM